MNKFILLFIFYIICSITFSQKTNSEKVSLEKSSTQIWAENWYSTSISFDLNDYWKFSFENQLRVKHIDEKFDRNFIELDIQRLFKSEFFNIIIGGSYRYLLINDDVGSSKSIENHKRFSYFIAQKIKIDRLSIRARIQYQSRKELLPEINLDLSDFSKYWRFKAEFGYNIKNWKLDPKISIEYFSRNKNHNWNQFNKYRIGLKTKCDLNKKHSIGLKYIIERQLREWNPELVHVFGIKYNYRIKHHTPRYKAFINEE